MPTPTSFVFSITLAAAFVPGQTTAPSTPLPATPPMKMGLWETAITTTMSGGQLPQNLQPTVIKAQSCFTPQTWVKSLQSGPASVCSRSNESYADGRYATDLTCKSLMATGHLEVAFASPESGHGKIHLDANISGAKFSADTTLDMRFISTDCGAVTPDRPVITK